MPPFFCLVHAELHRQCFSGLFYYLFDKSATYRRRILRIYPNLRRPCGSLWVLCRGFFRNQTADFYIFLPAAAAKLSFSHVLILYMLPCGLFPERQRNENLKLPVLNIRNERPAVFAADSLHVAHSVATASGSAPCALYKCHFNSLLRFAAVAHGNFKRTLRLSNPNEDLFGFPVQKPLRTLNRIIECVCKQCAKLRIGCRSSQIL